MAFAVADADAMVFGLYVFDVLAQGEKGAKAVVEAFYVLSFLSFVWTGKGKQSFFFGGEYELSKGIDDSQEGESIHDTRREHLKKC